MARTRWLAGVTRPDIDSLDPRPYSPICESSDFARRAQAAGRERWQQHRSARSRARHARPTHGRAKHLVFHVERRRDPFGVAAWQVSDGGGIQARWRRNSREIYYRSGGRLVAVTVDASGADPMFGKPVALFGDDYNFGPGASIANYDVTIDGRFIMIRRGASGGKLRVVLNWTEELKQLLASSGVQ